MLRWRWPRNKAKVPPTCACFRTRSDAHTFGCCTTRPASRGVLTDQFIRGCREKHHGERYDMLTWREPPWENRTGQSRA
eukprot:892686-Prymnesium_polylepis.1